MHWCNSFKLPRPETHAKMTIPFRLHWGPRQWWHNCLKLAGFSAADVVALLIFFESSGIYWFGISVTVLTDTQWDLSSHPPARASHGAEGMFLSPPSSRWRGYTPTNTHDPPKCPLMLLRSFGDKLKCPITPLVKNIYKRDIFPACCHMGQSGLSNAWSVGVEDKATRGDERPTMTLHGAQWLFWICYVLLHTQEGRNDMVTASCILVVICKAVCQLFPYNQVPWPSPGTVWPFVRVHYWEQMSSRKGPKELQCFRALLTGSQMSHQ